MGKGVLRATAALTKASIKMHFRNFTAVFFSLLFPVIFLLVFGYVNSNDQLRLDVAYLNQSQTVPAGRFDQALKGVAVDPVADEAANKDKILKIKSDITTADQARQQIIDGDLNAAIVVPSDFGKAGNGSVVLMVDQSDANFASILTQVVEGILGEFNQQATIQQLGRAPVEAFQAKIEGVQTAGLEAIDYVVPGIIAFSIMSLGIFSIAQGFVSFKASGALRRLKVAPVHALSFLIGQSLTQLILSVMQVIIMLVIAIILFDFSIVGSWLSFIAFAVLGTILFLGFGFAIAGWAKDENQAAPIANIVFFPMMFLSGTFFPRELFPDWLQPVAGFLPLTYVADGLRQIANFGTSILSLGPELVGVAVWTVVIYAVAVKLFRWE